ncbi:MAG: NHLP family bacteriocin export ABC transporter peptidase/permease/ATPase subunit [Rhodobacteraceae bacterium]|nr:NHLP family bacteriocin export ABC transporter peptidase/permease/ATPase subunit [Paracoccaceae bacterium]
MVARADQPVAGRRPGQVPAWRAALPVFRRRVRTPTVFQMETTECGAACLNILLSYYGRHLSMEQLRQECGISRDGTNAAKLVQVAQRHGLIAKGFRMDVRRLRQTPLPVIVFWNFNHFVVIEGFGRNRVWLNDPAQGRRSLPLTEFEEAFTGVVLAFRPGDGFARTARPPSPLRMLARKLRGSLGAFAFLLLAGFFLVCIGILTATFTRIFVDKILIDGQAAWLWPLIWFMLAGAAAQFLVTWMQMSQLTRLRTKLAMLWATGMTWSILRLPMSFFAQRSAGDLANRVTLADRAAQLVGGELAIAFVSLISVLMLVGVMVQYNPMLTAVGVSLALFNVLAFWLASRSLRDAHQRLQLDRAKADGMMMQGLRMVDTFKASGTEDIFFNRWSGHHAHTVAAEQRVGRLQLLVTLMPAFFGTVTATAILVVGGGQVIAGALSIGMLLAFQTLMQLFLRPIETFVGVGARLQEATGVIRRMDDVMAQSEDREFAQAPARWNGEPQLAGHLVLKDVVFGFNPLEPPVLRSISLDLPPGRRIAIVGGSGSGKSTLGRLIAGLCTPWDGVYTIDGFALPDLPRDVLRQSVAMVDQEVTVFAGTVQDNIAMWDASIPEEWVIQASKDACLHDEIANRAGGYGHVLQEGGANLSGGQRQRLEIARALVGNPSVLVLDEATSALDTETESQVIENLRRRGCSMVVIAHRVSAIRDADEIVVLEEGRIARRGTFAGLVADDPAFRALMRGGAEADGDGTPPAS